MLRRPCPVPPAVPLCPSSSPPSAHSTLCLRCVVHPCPCLHTLGPLVRSSPRPTLSHAPATCVLAERRATSRHPDNPPAHLAHAPPPAPPTVPTPAHRLPHSRFSLCPAGCTPPASLAPSLLPLPQPRRRRPCRHERRVHLLLQLLNAAQHGAQLRDDELKGGPLLGRAGPAGGDQGPEACGGVGRQREPGAGHDLVDDVAGEITLVGDLARQHLPGCTHGAQAGRQERGQLG